VVLDRNAVARDKLRVDTRLKLLACWSAGSYAQRLEAKLEHSGAVGFVLNVHDRPKGES
jgi:hypothetical protein